AVVRLVVLLDEVPDVDLFLPQPGLEPIPPGGCFLSRRAHVCFPKMRSLSGVQHSPNKDAVCRAIISSSLVGITQTETLLCGLEIRGPLTTLAASSSSIPSHADASLIRLRISAEFSPMPAVNTSASTPPRTAASAPISLAVR